MTDQNPLAALRAAAEAVRQQLQVNAFDAAGVQRLNDFIEAERVSLQGEGREGVIKALGCFLGECLVQTYQGTWAAGPDDTTGVGLHNKLFFNPFYRVEQHMTHGAAESVAGFFLQLPDKLRTAATRKNWI